MVPQVIVAAARVEASALVACVARQSPEQGNHKGQGEYRQHDFTSDHDEEEELHEEVMLEAGRHNGSDKQEYDRHD